mgnify:CR=1 FL=1|jgi:hypothetical protein
MKEYFKNFCALLLANQNALGTVISKDNISNIEFKMPIITFGNVLGYNYLGIEKRGNYYEMYINTKSLFKKINGKRTTVLKNMEIEYYNEIMNDLLMSQMMNPKYMKIATGKLF